MAVPLAANSTPIVPTTVATPVLPAPRASTGSGPSEPLRESTFQPLEEGENSQATGLRQRQREIPGEEERSSGDGRQEQQEQREDQQEIRRLRARDREVHAHEQAHVSVGGRYAGSASFSFTRGPDGVLYATGGEVPIDVSVIPGDPEATLRKMQVVQRAALAPADPSAADRSIAAQAVQAQITARAEIAREAAEQRETQTTDTDRRDEDTAASRLERRLAGTGALASSSETERSAGAVVDTRI